MTPNLDQERVERAAEAVYAVSVAAIEPGLGIKMCSFSGLPERDRKLHEDYARAAIAAYLGDDGPVDAAAIWKQAEACVPTNWCDDLLTGPNTPRGPLDCPAVEKLLLGIIKRMRARATTPTVNGKGE